MFGGEAHDDPEGGFTWEISHPQAQQQHRAMARSFSARPFNSAPPGALSRGPGQSQQHVQQHGGGIGIARHNQLQQQQPWQPLPARVQVMGFVPAVRNQQQAVRLQQPAQRNPAQQQAQQPQTGRAACRA